MGKKVWFAVAFACLAAGCVSDEEVAAANKAKADQLERMDVNIKATCHSYLECNTKHYEAIVSVYGPMPPDLEEMWRRYLAVYEQVDNHKISLTEANAQVAMIKNEIDARRQQQANNEAIATAALMSSMPMPSAPVTCNSFGVGFTATTTCY